MGEEIFGDKSPHQVSVSEGSGNAGSSRSRSGKFKADTSRRINVDSAEGELVSRHISSDDETHVTGGIGAHGHDPLSPHADHGHTQGVHLETHAARSGPVQKREALSDHVLPVSEDASEENIQALPGAEDPGLQRIRIPEQAAIDNRQALPETDAAAPNLAHLPSTADVQNRVALPHTGPSDAAQGPIIQADASHRESPVTNTTSGHATSPTSEPSNHPHSAPLAKPEFSGHREGLTPLGEADHRVPLDGDRLADRHLPVPGEPGHADNRQTIDAQALHDHHEPLPGETASNNVQYLPPSGDGLASVDIGPAQHHDGHQTQAEHDENEALAPTHLDDGAEHALTEVAHAPTPAPQAVKLQADLWREGFRGRVAQIKEQVALIHENLDKLEK